VRAISLRLHARILRTAARLCFAGTRITRVLCMACRAQLFHRAGCTRASRSAIALHAASALPHAHEHRIAVIWHTLPAHALPFWHVRLLFLLPRARRWAVVGRDARASYVARALRLLRMARARAGNSDK